MKVIAYGCEYECASATKTEDSVFLYDEYGNEIGAFGGIRDMSAYSVEGGDWSVDANAEIASLKAELQSTDYKIIKCSEAQLVGEELPYDIVTLHAERQALRDRINELEG